MQLLKLFHKYIYPNFKGVKIFVNYIIAYFKADFKITQHVLIGLFLALSIYFNYLYSEKIIYRELQIEYRHTSTLVWIIFGFFSFAFLFSLVLIYSTTKDRQIRSPFNTKYILFGLVGLILVATDASYYITQFYKQSLHGNPYISRWISACFSNLSSLATVIIPLYLLYYSTRYFKPESYGLRLNGARVLPYFWLILFMIPLLFLASLQPDFLETYPSYTDYHEYHYLGIDQWITVGIYELCYGFDFLSVELFFRGFMVIALSRFAGKDALLPMVAVYCFLHFGKPMGEAISSIFGGYILGILAYSSRNIYGGLIAHLGVAWGMEYFAYLHN